MVLCFNFVTYVVAVGGRGIYPGQEDLIEVMVSDETVNQFDSFKF